MKGIVAAFIVCASSLFASAQQKTFLIFGKVTDSASHQPLAGASVFCQNTTYGAVSSAEGRFGLRLPAGGYDLIVSYTGYEKKSIRISNTHPENDTMTI